MYRLGIDIGGTKASVGITDSGGRLLTKEKLYISQMDHMVAEICACARKLADSAHISWAEIGFCGIGVPGTVSPDGKTAVKIPNLKLENTNLSQDFETILNLPVTLVQDSRAAAWGEYRAGNGIGYRCIVCVTLGTGIGTGIIIDGKIYNGVLGSAGELGHIPAVPDGRKCGCGQNGCMEKYASGRGLDITAAALYGEGKNAAYLFEQAKAGEPEASAKITEALELLGNAMISIINLLSPDCLLISGGLLAQKELYIEPLISYIKARCYSTNGNYPYIGTAALGEDAPLVGAALVPQEPCRTKPELSASIMCADVLNFGKALREIEEAGIQYLHCDIMDNQFVPNLMLPMELLNQLRSSTSLPFDFHIMAEKPDTVIEKLELRKGDIVSVHCESTIHLQRVLDLVRQKEAIPAVALNPATPLECVREVLDDVGMILIMTVNPGLAGQKIVEQSFDKVKRTKQMLQTLGYSHIRIEVDGNCSFENVPKLYNAGADLFVVGTSSVFKKGLTIREGTEKLYQSIK